MKKHQKKKRKKFLEKYEFRHHSLCDCFGAEEVTFIHCHESWMSVHVHHTVRKIGSSHQSAWWLSSVEHVQTPLHLKQGHLEVDPQTKGAPKEKPWFSRFGLGDPPGVQDFVIARASWPNLSAEINRLLHVVRATRGRCGLVHSPANLYSTIYIIAFVMTSCWVSTSLGTQQIGV